MMKQIYDPSRALEWAAIDAALDCQANAIIERLERAHQIRNSCGFVHLAKASIDLHFSMGRYDIASGPAANHPHIKAGALRRIIQGMQALSLPRQFEDRAGAFFRV